MRIAVAAGTLVTLLATAHAEPVESDVPDEKSPAMAIGLSLSATVLPLALSVGIGMTGHPEDHLALYSAGLYGAFFGPSVGHWYAGDYVTPGLLGRGAGAVMLGVGFGMSLKCLGSQEPHCEADPMGEVVAVSGIVVMAGSAIYDIATAGRAARRWNHAHVQIAPTMVGTSAHSALGMGVTGTF